jgi:UDP-N-acetylglucosamine--N-acetylmuramyl-(pentapeptide) pyrophosphoryl-undecaprenol N-acetylglucosamine transferase
MAGGTGGHIMPGLAVAAVLRERGWRVLWLGNPDKMEGRLVPAQGIEMAELRFQGVRGRGTTALLQLPMRLFTALRQAWGHLSATRPDVVLGMGGYIAFPGGMMASLLNRPLVLHEQNSIAGLANKVLAQVADRILTGFPGALKKGEWTGNPVRAAIAALPAPEARYGERQGNLRLLVIGGSLGAQALNEVVPKALALMPATQRPVVTHQAGEKHIDVLERNYREAGVAASSVAFIHDMAAAYAEADLVICRAGALTVAELAAAGVPSVLVPFPHAVDDHQTTNARFLSEQSAAVLIPQSQLDPRGLADVLLGFTREKLLDMARRARSLGKPDATRVVAEHCMAAAA